MRQDLGMTTSNEVWEAITRLTPRGEWLSLAALYDIVSRDVTLSPEDELAISAKNRSPRWKRTTRNALQRHKLMGDIEWDGAGRYRLP